MYFRSRLVLVFAMLLITSNLNAQCITVFPHTESFETTNGNWTPGGVNSDWAWGSPGKVRINAAGAGSKCWITGGLTSAVYNGGQKSWIESPCYDFSSLQRPYVSFLIYWDTERQYDGGNLQYSTNNGVSWTNVGNSATNVHCRISNWFNAPSINNLSGLANPTQGWSGSSLPSSGSCLGGNGSGEWKEARYCLTNLAGEANVVFRFTFCSGTTCNNYDGMAIDSFSIAEFQGPVVDFTYQCLSDSSVQFKANITGCPTTSVWDFGDPSSSQNSSVNPLETHVFSGPGVYQVSWTLTEPCIGTYIKTRTVVIPDARPVIYAPSCPGAADGAIKIEAVPVPGLTFNWNVPGGFSGDSLGQLIAGNYQVIVNADSACATVVDVHLKENIAGGPDINLPSVLFICPPEIISLNAGVFPSYLWSDGSSAPAIDAVEAGTYTVTVTDLNGCTGEDSVRVVENCFTDMFFPTAFTPNNDGKNEVFFPVSGVVAEYRLDIYDRFGQLIFTSNNQETGWDGTWQQVQSPGGIYVWIVNYTGPDHKNKTERGFVTLFR